MKFSQRPPRLIFLPLRILLITGLFTLVAFAITVLLGLIGTVGWSALNHTHPDLTIVYRYIAPFVTLVVASVVLIIASVHEIRRYRQNKTLAAIERISA